MSEVNLRDAINDLVITRLKLVMLTGEMINLPDWVSDMAASMADMILQQPEEEQRRLMDHAHKQLDRFWARRGN
jgi:hypothetical protein